MEAEEKEGPTIDQILGDWANFYKIPLIFTFVAVSFLAVAFFIWQKNEESAKVIFTQEKTETESIKADIEGAIVNPGVYELNSGSRIQDLLIVAGGLSAEADREWLGRNLNLAAKIIDGGKVYVPKLGEQKTGGVLGSGDVSGKININTASLSELDKLSGVGPVTAQKIIDGRPYQTIEELLNKKIVGKSIFEKIQEKISVY